MRPWVYPSMRTTERVRQRNDGAGTCYETVPNKNAVRGSLSLSRLQDLLPPLALTQGSSSLQVCFEGKWVVGCCFRRAYFKTGCRGL